MEHIGASLDYKFFCEQLLITVAGFGKNNKAYVELVFLTLYFITKTYKFYFKDR